MGVRVTDDRHVGIYDSVSMTAIQSPLFDSEKEARAFLVWLAGEGHDARVLGWRGLDALHSRWLQEREVAA